MAKPERKTMIDELEEMDKNRSHAELVMLRKRDRETIAALTPQPQIDVEEWECKPEEFFTFPQRAQDGIMACMFQIAKVREECRNLLRTAPENTGEWQPIESAPKDRHLLVWDTKNNAVFIGRRSDKDTDWITGVRQEGKDGNQIVTSEALLIFYIYPSHWMPLPPPPVLTTQKGKSENE